MKGMALPFKRVVKLYRITIVFFLLGSIQTNSHIYPLLNSMARNLGNLILKHSIILICRNGTCLQFLSHLTFSPHVHTHIHSSTASYRFLLVSGSRRLVYAALAPQLRLSFRQLGHQDSQDKLAPSVLMVDGHWQRSLLYHIVNHYITLYNP